MQHFSHHSFRTFWTWNPVNVNINGKRKLFEEQKRHPLILLRKSTAQKRRKRRAYHIIVYRYRKNKKSSMAVCDKIWNFHVKFFFSQTLRKDPFLYFRFGLEIGWIFNRIFKIQANNIFFSVKMCGQHQMGSIPCHSMVEFPVNDCRLIGHCSKTWTRKWIQVVIWISF